MASPEEAKRVKIMLLVVILLVLVLVVKGNKGGSSAGGNILDKIVGVNLKAKKQEFDDARNLRDMVRSDKIRFEEMENQLIEEKADFWMYTKAGTPRGEAQQRIIRLGKDYGIDGIRVSIGTERTLPSCQYLKYIDFSVSSRDFDMKSLADFLEAIDKDSGKYHWKELRIYRSGKSLAFSAGLRVYVFSNKAVALFGKSK